MDKITFGAFYGGFRYGEGIAEVARQVEKLGFDGFWCGEHLLLRGPTVDALTAMAVATGATQKITIGSAILLLPLHHPTFVAKAVTTLDYASKGRVILGVGTGGEYPKEFEAVGVPLAERGRRMNEGLELLRRLWTEDSVTFQGKFYQLQEVSLDPKPLQKPQPPIWIAGRRDAAMRRAAMYGDGWLPYLYTPERYKESTRIIEKLGEDIRRDLSGFQHALLVYIGIYESKEEAQRIAAINHGITEDSEGLVERYDLLGTPKACIERIEQFVEAGVRHFIFNWACNPQDIPRHMETISRDIIPYFH